MRAARRNALSTALEPLAGLMWPLFLFWTALIFIIAPFGIGESQALDWIPGGSSSGTLQAMPASTLESAVIALLASADALWILLAAINVYILFAQAEGIATARKWAAIVLAGSAALTWTNAITGFPLGPQSCTSVLGWKIGHVLPLSVPLLWLVVVLTSRSTVLLVFPRANLWAVSIGTALLALCTDFNLEPAAWKIRAYWIWYPLDFAPPPHPPVQNYATWFAATFALSLILGENKETAVRRSAGLRPVAILFLFNALFLSVHAVHWFRL